MKPYRVLLSEFHKQHKPNMSLHKVANSELTLYVYDIIGEDFFGEGVTPKNVSEILDSETFTSVTVRIDSPGGDPFAAAAIVNLLKATAKPITVVVDGLAASAASVLAMVGDDIRMGEGSMMMVHNAWTLAAGNASELRKMADDLEKISATMRELYVNRTGLTSEEVQQIMDAETWLSAQDAIDKGFADAMVEPDKASPAPDTSAVYRTKLEYELELL